MKRYVKSYVDPNMTNDDFHQAMSQLSWDSPGYTDTSNKGHKWLGKRVVIDFAKAGYDYYPSKKVLYVIKCDYPYINLSPNAEDVKLDNPGNAMAYYRFNSDSDKGYKVWQQIKQQLGSYFE